MPVKPARAVTPRPHIVILTSVHEPFDPRIFHKQARSLAVAGYRVTLLAPHDRDEWRDGVRVWGVPPAASRLGRPLVWGRLLRRALRLRADAYHFHDPELLPLGWLLARLSGRPVLYDAHEYYRAEVSTRRWLPRPVRRLAAETVHAVETLAVRRLAAVVAVNEHMAAGFRARGARCVVAVHNYPLLSSFPSHANQQPPTASTIADGESSIINRQSSMTVSYIGVLSRERGLELVWQAAQRLRDLAPAADVRLIGRIDWSGVDEAVSREPARWQAEAGARLVGVIQATAIPAALAETAVGWVPFQPTANNCRTIPLKLLEYLAAGLPVVASDFGYLAQIVRAADCGLLVPAADAEAHAQALAHLLTHSDEAQALGERGRRAVQERYSWEAESRRLLDLYATLLGPPAGQAVGNDDDSETDGAN